MAASCVLCGVDESPAAANVISVAARLRERLGLRLVIAHAVREPVTVGVATVPYAYPYQPETEVARDTPEELLEAIVRRSPEAERAELRAATGDPVETLLSLADDEHAELLVVGSRGRGPLGGAARQRLVGRRDARELPRCDRPATERVRALKRARRCSPALSARTN